MAWKLLFGSDIGLMSLFSILIVIAIGVYLYFFLRKKMAEEDKPGEPRG